MLEVGLWAFLEILRENCFLLIWVIGRIKVLEALKSRFHITVAVS